MKSQLRCFIVLLLALWSKNLFSQSPAYSDALFLYENCFSKTDGVFIKDTNFYAVLKNYYPNGTPSNEELRKNSFFRDYIPVSKAQSGTALTYGENKSKGFLSLGNADITTIADGFAKFIVKRTKQELSIAFFEKFNKELNSIKDLQTLFPQTYRTLSMIGEDIYLFDSYIQALRESFNKDLASLPSNFPSIIENHPDYFTREPELKAILLSSFYFAQQVQNKQHIGKIISDFPIEYLNNDTVAKSAFQIVQLISTSLQDPNSNSYWASMQDIRKMTSDTTLFKIYLGLVFKEAQNENIVLYCKNNKGIRLDSLMNSTHLVVASYISYFRGFAQKAQLLDEQIKNINKIGSDSLLLENYYRIISSSVDLMRYAVTIEDLPFLKDDSLDLYTKTKKYFDLMQATADMTIDVNRRDYASAVVNGSFVISSIFDTTNVKDEKTREKYAKIASEFFKYGSFMATVAQAESSDDVEAAIEAIALPTGSARIKRESAFNVSLNAYCGMFAGYEKIEGIDFGHKEINFDFSNWNSYGVTAPIGFAASWGHFFPFTKCRMSSSIFVSIIDIGALTAFRFTNDSTESVPKIELANILSPGIFYSIGIPKCPISINIGYQIGPLLRKVTAVSNTYSSKYSRFSISLCVDLPVLNLYTKSRQ